MEDTIIESLDTVVKEQVLVSEILMLGTVLMA